MCLQPVAGCPSTRNLGSVLILHTDFEHPDSAAGLLTSNSAVVPAHWMGLFLEADFPSEMGVIFFLY